uniref:Calponin-homology (CH) domain-containing protein n=1 Tax=Syphacia muris TaxID=451379 RepID=A0A0N5ABA0_9BILA
MEPLIQFNLYTTFYPWNYTKLIYDNRLLDMLKSNKRSENFVEIPMDKQYTKDMKLKDVSLYDAIETVARYRAEFLSSTLNASAVSPRSGFMQGEGRESSVAGCSSSVCDSFKFENEKENSASFDINRESNLSRLKLETGSERTPNSGDNGNVLFAVPSLPRKSRLRRSSSFGGNQTRDLRNCNENVEFYVSPGTNASRRTMENKLMALRARDAARKEALQKSRRERSLSRQKVDLEATARKFLFSEDLNNTVSMPSGLNYSGLPTFQPSNGDSSDATYVLSRFNQGTPLLQKKSAVMPPTVSLPKQEAALKAWVNFLVRQRYGSERLCSVFEKDKCVAENFLRSALRDQLSKDSSTKINFADSKSASVAERKLVADVVTNMRKLLDKNEVLMQLDNMLQKGAFKIRAEVHLFSDVGLQIRLLKMLFSLHIFWLRCGLEAVFNVSFNGLSCNLHRKLVRFVIRHFFKEPAILSNPKYAKGRNRSVITELGREELGRNFQSKFYRLLYSVDCTKSEARFSKQTPNVFLSESSFKNIEDVVNVLQKEILSGAVNASKLLSRIGVGVKYRQGFLDEYHYFVKDLYTDLSDGVILCRLIEVVYNLQPDSIGWSLRNPSGDRLRKLGNVKKVLEAAKSNGLDLGEVKADDIVKGKSEEILEAIWRIVGVYVTTTENICCSNDKNEYDPELWWQAAIRIQRAYRKYRKKKEAAIDVDTGVIDNTIVTQLHNCVPGANPSGSDGPAVKAAECENEIFVPQQVSNNVLTGAVDDDTFVVADSASVRLSEPAASVTAIMPSSSTDLADNYNFVDCTSATNADIVGSHVFSIEQLVNADENATVTLSSVCDVNSNESDKSITKSNTSDVKKVVEFGSGVSIASSIITLTNDIKQDEASLQTVIEDRVVSHDTDGAGCSCIGTASCHGDKDSLKENISPTICQTPELMNYQKAEELDDGEENLHDLSLQLINKKKLETEAASDEILGEDCDEEVCEGMLEELYRKCDIKLKVPLDGDPLSSTKRHLRHLKLLQLKRAQKDIALKQDRVLKELKKHWRKFNAVKHYQKFQKRQKAALVIQGWWRCTRARMTFKKLVTRVVKCNEAAKLIQRAWRLRQRKECERRLLEQSAVIIQKHVRGFLTRRKLAGQIAIVQKRMEDFRAKDAASCTERSRPALFRVIDALEDLLSGELERRDHAALTLGRLTTLSDQCGLYIYKQKGLSFLLDSLDSCNRGLHERQVVIHLLLCLSNILKIKTVQEDIGSNRQLAEDLVKSCFHYLSAFYNVHVAAQTLMESLIVVANANSGVKEFPGAKYYVNQALQRFKRFGNNSDLFTTASNMQHIYMA